MTAGEGRVGEVWTKAHRARHEAGLKELVSVDAVRQIAGWLERADPPRSGRATPILRVVGAIAWHLRVGGPWRALPPGWPPWRTVYGWFRRWLDLGLFEALLREVARRRRRKPGGGRGRAWASSTPRSSSASRSAVHAATMRPRMWWGASAWPWSTRTGTYWRSL